MKRDADETAPAPGAADIGAADIGVAATVVLVRDSGNNNPWQTARPPRGAPDAWRRARSVWTRGRAGIAPLAIHEARDGSMPTCWGSKCLPARGQAEVAAPGRDRRQTQRRYHRVRNAASPLRRGKHFRLAARRPTGPPSPAHTSISRSSRMNRLCQQALSVSAGMRGVVLAWCRRALAVFVQPSRRSRLMAMLRRVAMALGAWSVRTREPHRRSRPAPGAACSRSRKGLVRKPPERPVARRRDRPR